MNSFYAILSVLLVSLVSLIGIISISIKKKQLEKTLFILVSFSVGALFGDAFFHLIPESFEAIPNQTLASLFVVVGIIIFFSLEKFIRWRHCHHAGECEEHKKPVGTMNLIGDGVHNFIDGLLIGASYLVSVPVGIATTTAIILHEIPSEIGDYGVLLHSGMKLKRVIMFNFLSASLAVAGAFLALFLGSSAENLATYLVPVAAGGFIYIAGSDLIPELHHETSFKSSIMQLASISAGILIMVALLYVG